MAFYIDIDIDKIKESDMHVQYQFYTSGDNVGVVEIRKSDGHVSEIQVAPDDSL